MVDAIEKASNFLRRLLAAGPMPVKEIGEHAAAADISWATIERAKAVVGIVALRQSHGSSGAGKWLWTIPQSQEQPQDTQGTQQDQQDAQARDAQAPPVPQDAHDQQSATVERRVIKVKPRGIATTGPDEISWELWEALGHDLRRVGEYVRERDAFRAEAMAEFRKHHPTQEAANAKT
jgi:hypothetical protein